MTTRVELEAALAIVREGRAIYQSSAGLKASLEIALKATPEWERLNAHQAAHSIVQQELQAAEAEARALALELYAETQDKHPAAGITVKIFTKIDYVLDAATAWARSAMPALLGLDTRAFEKIARSGGVADMPVTITEEPRAEIASVLP